jgi:hypothetical protein
MFEGGAWNRDGVIIFGGPDGLMQGSASDSNPVAVTKVDASRQETAHAEPVFLSDGRHFLYLRRSSVAEYSGIYVGRWTTLQPTKH